MYSDILKLIMEPDNTRPNTRPNGQPSEGADATSQQNNYANKNTTTGQAVRPSGGMLPRLYYQLKGPAMILVPILSFFGRMSAIDGLMILAIGIIFIPLIFIFHYVVDLIAGRKFKYSKALNVPTVVFLSVYMLAWIVFNITVMDENTYYKYSILTNIYGPHLKDLSSTIAGISLAIFFLSMVATIVSLKLAKKDEESTVVPAPVTPV